VPKDDKAGDSKIEFLQIAVDIYNGYKISKDGLSREEDVEVMKGVNDEEQGRNVGWKVFRRVFGGAEKSDGAEEPKA
jgi:hypothetical protein